MWLVAVKMSDHVAKTLRCSQSVRVGRPENVYAGWIAVSVLRKLWTLQTSIRCHFVKLFSSFGGQLYKR